ncbi:MAG: hypothetical protein P8080_02375 [Gammaproteobacteria bacterium]
MRWALPAVALALLGLAGCEAMHDKTDYHRHSMSSLQESRTEPGVLLFEVTTSSLFPADSEAAEAERMKWLEGWLDRLDFCPLGYEVLSREKIDPMEVNAYRHDLRYRVRCAGEPPPED